MARLTYKKVIIIGYIFSLILGVLLHFAYDFFNNNLIIGLFTPINESVFEHLKLISMPFLLFTVFFYIYSKKKITNVFLLGFFGSILGSFVTTLAFYIGTRFLGTDNTVFNIITYVLGVTTAFTTFYLGLYIDKLYTATQDSIHIGALAILLLIAFFIINTLIPLKLSINKDPVTGTYGIFKTN